MTYDVTPTGPMGFQVTATPLPGAVPHVVGNFASLVEAEAFADTMRQLDAGQSHDAAGKGLA